MSKRMSAIGVIILVLLLLFVGVKGRMVASYRSQLYVPTSVTKIDDTYFIMDCWQSRLLYSHSMDKPIEKWNIATEDIAGGHTVASDGELYITEDTEGSRIIVLKKNENSFEEVQTIDGITGRPHYSIYDQETRKFYVLSSGEGTIYVFENEGGMLKMQQKCAFDELQGSYIRSMSIIDSYLYLTAGPAAITKIDYHGDTLAIMDSYSVQEELYNMNYITKIQDYYYCTTNLTGEDQHSGIFRAKNLEDFATGNYEALYDKMGFEGTPYFISFFDDKYYITEVGENGNNGIRSFEINNNEITNVKKVFFFADVSEDSINRWHEKM